MTYVEIIHKYGQHACGKPAFLYRKDMIQRGAGILKAYALGVDGQALVDDVACVCGSCGYGLHPWMVLGEEVEIS